MPSVNNVTKSTKIDLMESKIFQTILRFCVED